MSVANSIRMGKRGGGDSKGRDLFSAMGQGSMPNRAQHNGLFNAMNQGSMKGTPGNLRPGRTACSVARSMGQGR